MRWRPQRASAWAADRTDTEKNLDRRPSLVRFYPTCNHPRCRLARAPTRLPNPVRDDGDLLRSRPPGAWHVVQPERHRDEPDCDLDGRATSRDGGRNRDRPPGRRRLDLGVWPDLL